MTQHRHRRFLSTASPLRQVRPAGTWNKLSPEDQKIIKDVAREVEDNWFVESVKLWDREEKALIAKGMQVTEMGKDEQAKMNAALSAGLWELSAQKSPKDIAALREFLRSKGLDK